MSDMQCPLMAALGWRGGGGGGLRVQTGSHTHTHTVARARAHTHTHNTHMQEAKRMLDEKRATEQQKLKHELAESRAEVCMCVYVCVCMHEFG